MNSTNDCLVKIGKLLYQNRAKRLRCDFANQDYIDQMNKLIRKAFVEYKSYWRKPFEIELIDEYATGNVRLRTGTFTGGITGKAQQTGQVKVVVAKDEDLGNWILFQPDHIDKFFPGGIDVYALPYVFQGIADFLFEHGIKGAQITVQALVYDETELRLPFLYKGAKLLLESLVALR